MLSSFNARWMVPVLVTLALAVRAQGDDQLDQMMNRMNQRRSHQQAQPTVSNEDSSPSAFDQISAAFNRISAAFSSTQSAPPEDAEDLNSIDDSYDSSDSPSAFSTLASAAVQGARRFVDEARQTVHDFPFPHWYWAPGIVGDATTAIFDTIDRNFMNEE